MPEDPGGLSAALQRHREIKVQMVPRYCRQTQGHAGCSTLLVSSVTLQYLYKFIGDA